MKVSREGGRGLFVGSREGLKDLIVARREREARIGVEEVGEVVQRGRVKRSKMWRKKTYSRFCY